MNVIEPQIAGGAATLPRLISVEEAATLLSVTDTTIRNWIKQDAIPYIELPGGEARQRKQYRIPLQGLLNTLAGNYDLAADLRQIDAAFGGERSAGEQEESFDSRARPRGGHPTEMDVDPSELFEQAQVSS
jgi:excisionase family DNA binding protein